MKILCKNCGAQIELLTLKESQKQGDFKCQKCGSQFTIRPKIGKDGFDIIFASAQQNIRNCINCGKKFYAAASDMIPTCPSCKEGSSVETSQFNAYFIYKSRSKKTGPFTLEEIGEIIESGNLNENDLLETPQSHREKAKDVLEFLPYFKNYYARVKGKTKKKHSQFTTPRISFSVKNIFILLFGALLITWIYLIILKTDRPNSPSVKKSRLLYQEWSKNFNYLNSPFDVYFKRGMKALRFFTPKTCGIAMENFSSAFMQDMGKPSVLPYISLSMACIASANGNRNLLEQSAHIAQIAIEEAPSLEISYLARAYSYFKLGKVHEAAADFEKFKSFKTKFALGYSLYAQYLYYSGSFDMAEKTVEESLSLDSSLSYSYYVRANGEYRQKQYENALYNIEKRIRSFKDDAEALELRANLLLNQRRYTSLKQDLTDSLKINPYNAKARILLSQIESSIFGNFTQALEHAKKILDPENEATQVQKSDALTIIASVNNEKGNYEAALKAADNGLSIKPGDPYLKFSKIKALLKTKSTNEALPILSDFLIGDIPYTGEIDIALALLLKQNGLNSQSIEFLDKYTQKKALLFFPFVQMSILLLDRNETQKAIDILKQGLIKTAPFTLGDFLPDIQLGVIRVNPKALAKELSRKGRNKINEDLLNVVKAHLLYQGNSNLSVQRDYSTPESLIKKAISKDSRIEQAYVILAMIYMRQGKSSLVQSLLKKAIDSGIKSPLFVFIDAIAMRNLKDPLKAKNFFEEYKDPIWPEFYVEFEKAKTQEMLGKSQEAKEMYAKSLKLKDNYYLAIKTH